MLRRITALLLSACEPDHIILFGSYAKAQQNIDSDLDLLVIGDFRGPAFLLERELRQVLHGLPIHIDLHVATPQEVAAESSKPFGFLGSILAGGVTLYTKNKTPQTPCRPGLRDANVAAFGKT